MTQLVAVGRIYSFMEVRNGLVLERVKVREYNVYFANETSCEAHAAERLLFEERYSFSRNFYYLQSYKNC